RRGKLDHERSDEAGHAAVDGGDRRRARVGAVAREPSVDEDGRALAEARRQRMDYLGVADELERDEAKGCVDVVLGHLVDVAFDRREHEVVDVLETSETVRDRVRLSKVEADPRSGLA